MYEAQDLSKVETCAHKWCEREGNVTGQLSWKIALSSGTVEAHRIKLCECTNSDRRKGLALE